MDVQPEILFEAVECPVCKRFIVPKANGTLPWHDNIPPCRSCCIASTFTLEEAKIIAADRRKFIAVDQPPITRDQNGFFL